MSDAIPYADIIILALVAGFILLRLRSVLGQNSDNPGGDFFSNLKTPKPKDEGENIVLPHMPLKAKTVPAEEDESLSFVSGNADKDAVQAIKLKDPQFSVTGFLSGAKMAFEMVFDAFAKGDKQTLSSLLSDEVLGHFTQEIDARKNKETHEEITLLSVRAKAVTSVTLVRNTARIAVDFVSEQVTLERDKDGIVVGGNASASVQVEDNWVFERDVNSKNPNWKIIET
jgi:predicted lipid-binding transport protein (Tim44 family)